MTRGGRARVRCVGAHPLYDGTVAVRFALDGVPALGLSVRAVAWARRPRRLAAHVFAPGAPAAFSVRVPEGARVLFLSLVGRGEDGLVRRRILIPAGAWRRVLRDWVDGRTNASDDRAYDAWMRAHKSAPEELARQRAEVATWEDAPLVSVVTPLFRTPEAYLREYLDCMLAQTYPNFELVLVNASGDCPPVDAVLAEVRDERVRILTVPNGGIAANTNAGIAAARGAFVGFVDHDDFIEPDALYRYMCAVRENPTCDLLFCDEDLFGGDEGEERYYGVRFKPGWDPDLLFCHNYVCHLLMVSRRALELTQRSGDDVTGAQDYDLTFKAAEVARAVCHVPHVLYHWREHPLSTARNRQSKPYCLEAGRLSVERHLARLGVDARVEEGAYPFSYRVRYALPEDARVSVLVAGGEAYARDVARRLEGAPAHVDVTRVEPNALERPLALSAAMLAAPAPYVLLLDETCTDVTPQLLAEQLGLLQRADVGAAGPLLLDEDDVVQADGLICRPDGTFGHAERGLARRDDGYMTMLVHAHGCSALPAAGLMVRRADVEGLGGLNPACGWLALQDLCLRLRERGMRCVVQPYAPLHVAGGMLPDADGASTQERATLAGLHLEMAAGDACLSPRMDVRDELFRLKREERA